MHSKYYIPAPAAPRRPYTVDVTPGVGRLDRIEPAGRRTRPLCRRSRWIDRRHRGDDPAARRRRHCRLRRRGLRIVAARIGVRRTVGHGLPRRGPDLRDLRRGPVCDLRRPCEDVVSDRPVAAADVSVELRGAGNCSRQVHNFGTAGVFEADSLIACEVITPGGNWSSYPAHKHDENTATESELEEIYYFEIAPGRTVPRFRLSPRLRHAGPADRGARGGPHRRRRAGAARLPRPVRRRARLSHVLPERDGRTGCRARLEDRRRPRTRLAPRDLGRARTSTRVFPLHSSPAAAGA